METEIIKFIINTLGSAMISFIIQPGLCKLYPETEKYINWLLFLYTTLITFINQFLL